MIGDDPTISIKSYFLLFCRIAGSGYDFIPCSILSEIFDIKQPRMMQDDSIENQLFYSKLEASIQFQHNESEIIPSYKVEN